MKRNRDTHTITPIAQSQKNIGFCVLARRRRKKSPRELHLFSCFAFFPPFCSALLFALPPFLAFPFHSPSASSTLPSLPSLPSWRMAGRSAPAPRTLSPAATAAAHRRGRWGLPTRRRYRIWSLGSTVSLCQLWLHFHLRCQRLGSLSLHFANLGSSLPSLSLHFANYLRFTHHFHFTLPTLAPLSPHFANLGSTLTSLHVGFAPFSLQGYVACWQIATQSGVGRYGFSIADADRGRALAAEKRKRKKVS